jgi:hypothetical protein
MFINAMQASGLVREVIDFDSPFIIGQPPELTLSPGAVSSCYTQTPRSNPPPGYKFMPASSFAHLTSHIKLRPDGTRDDGQTAHACIGFMMYHTANDHQRHRVTSFLSDHSARVLSGEAKLQRIARIFPMFGGVVLHLLYPSGGGLFLLVILR